MTPTRKHSRESTQVRDTRSLPGPSGLREWFRDIWSIPADPLAGLSVLRDKYGDALQFYNPALRATTILLSDPHYVEHVLQSNQDNYRKADTYEFLKPLLGEGLLTSSGDRWLQDRRLIAPMFHRKSIRNFADIMVEDTLDMLERWEGYERKKEVFDLWSEMRKLTLDIVGRSLFSTPMEDLGDEVGDALKTVMRYVDNQATSLIRLPLWVPTPGNIEAREAMTVMTDIVDRLIGDRRGSAKDYDDLLSMLLLAEDEETGERMNDQQIRDQIMTFILAGHETTANALTWTLYLLSKHPEIEATLHESSRDFQSLGEDPFETLENYEFSKQVVKEGMRLYPPAWVVERTPIEDDVIDGYRIPEGSIVMLCSRIVHRHQDVWSDPDAFRPSRFGSDGQNRPKFSYFPFGGGKRICIGNEFAMMEARIILTLISQRFRVNLEQDEPIDYEALVTLQPKDGINISLNRWSIQS